jgi:hypothetical protein
MEHWWSDTDGGNLKYGQINLSQWHFVQNKSIWIDQKSNFGLRGDWPVAKCLILYVILTVYMQDHICSLQSALFNMYQ